MPRGPRIHPHPTSGLRGVREHIACALAFLVTAILMISPASASGDEIKITAAVDAPEVQPGNMISFTVTFDGAQPEEVPALKLPPDVNQLSPRPELRFESVFNNGVVQNMWMLSWRISAVSNGEYVIPPQEYRIRGKVYRSNEVRFTAKENPEKPASQFDPILTMELEKRELYVGEVVPVIVNIYMHRMAQARRIGLIEVDKDSFAIQRFPLQPEESIVPIGGVPYRARAFRSTLSALKPGKFKLGPASSDIILDVPADDNSNGMRSPYFRQMETRNVKVRGNEIEVTVLPLPDKGRPAKFSGLVGDFNLTVSAEPHDLSVGDPISVEFNYSGSGNFDALAAPDITGPPVWKTYPARRINVTAPDPTGETVQQHATFNQVFIPKDAVKEIPPFEITYFSPTKKEYITARTQPIALNVKPVDPRPSAATQGGAGTRIAAGDASAAAASEPEKVSPPPVKITDIVTVMPESSSWLAVRPVLWHDRTFITANAIALGSLLALLIGKGLVVLWQSRSEGPSAAARRLWTELRGRRLSRGAFYQAAAQYVRHHTAENPSNADALQKIIDTHHRLNFSSASADAQAALDGAERRDVLNQLRLAAAHRA